MIAPLRRDELGPGDAARQSPGVPLERYEAVGSSMDDEDGDAFAELARAMVGTPGYRTVGEPVLFRIEPLSPAHLPATGA